MPVTDEYVGDVPYLRQFVSELSPGRLRMIAALNGVTPPSSLDFDYCELGCGHGDTVAALAAAHPEGRFLGVDINADHIASARRLSRGGGLTNIGFLQRDFAELMDEDTGEFDFIAAHGVLSWVGPEKRRALMQFAQRKLKPGGLLYVSYNAMPGWAAVEPLRQLLLSPIDEGGAITTPTSSSTLDRAARGLTFAAAMSGAGAEYFRKNPVASEMIGTMERTGLPYVVHEYMHEHWAPMYFAHVAWQMKSHDLHFVGVLPTYLNYRELAVPAAVESLLSSVTDRIAFESLKDYAVNEFFRNDVYVKGVVPRSAEVTNEYLDSTPWYAPHHAARELRSVELRHRTVSLDAPLIDGLNSALEDGPVVLRHISHLEAFAGIPMEKLRAAIMKLIVVERVIPLAAAARPRVTAERYVLPSTYNQMIIKRVSTEMPLVMVSTTAGTAFPISALEALAIRVITEVSVQARPSWVHDFAARNVLRLRIGDRIVDNAEEQVAAILRAIDELLLDRLGKYLELGILEAPNQTPESASSTPGASELL